MKILKHIKTLDGDIMLRQRCISCGLIINNEALHDSHVCKDCDDQMIYEDENTYIMKI